MYGRRQNEQKNRIRIRSHHDCGVFSLAPHRRTGNPVNGAVTLWTLVRRNQGGLAPRSTFSSQTVGTKRCSSAQEDIPVSVMVRGAIAPARAGRRCLGIGTLSRHSFLRLVRSLRSGSWVALRSTTRELRQRVGTERRPRSTTGPWSLRVEAHTPPDGVPRMSRHVRFMPRTFSEALSRPLRSPLTVRT